MYALGKGTVVSGFMREGNVEITHRKKVELRGFVQLFASPEGATVLEHHGGTSTRPSHDAHSQAATRSASRSKATTQAPRSSTRARGGCA